jgi:glycosyltransferase involved in cell wall biosynthesis
MRRKYRIPETTPYILSLCTLEPRKNLINIIKAFQLLIQKYPDRAVILVIAGQKGWKFDDIFRFKNSDRNRIIFTGFIAEEDLATIYSDAVTLAYISYYEGFGLPPLEAMSCGTPVIYGNNSSMPEVISYCGLAAEPDNIEDIADKFQRILCDANLREKLSRLALARAQQFSWEKSALETLAAYDSVIAGELINHDFVKV